MRTIVVSAVNIRKGGTLTILRNCLEYLSDLAQKGDYRIVALVHRKELAEYSGIEYIEMPDTIKSWSRRLWCEYVTMYRISKSLAPVYLWFSLHDTTPRVIAEKQAVYCQTSFPFLHWRLKDLAFDYKIVLFALFTRFAYRINIKRNRFLVVQADWLRKGFSKMFGLPESKFIVAPPRQQTVSAIQEKDKWVDRNGVYIFLFAATPDCHKNFEIVCRASQLLEKEVGSDRFQVIFTIDGTENKYAHWLYQKWGKISSLKFEGLMNRTALFACYAQVDCLVFPSRVETWGLPISEFAAFNKPMLLADLPYAHETAMGSRQAAFFNVQKADELKEQMKRLLQGDRTFLKPMPVREIVSPVAYTWKELLDRLLEMSFDSSNKKK